MFFQFGQLIPQALRETVTEIFIVLFDAIEFVFPCLVNRDEVIGCRWNGSR